MAEGRSDAPIRDKPRKLQMSPSYERRECPNSNLPRRPFQGKAKNDRGGGGRITADERDREDDDMVMCSQNLAEGPELSSHANKAPDGELFAGMHFIMTSLWKSKQMREDLNATVTQHGGILSDLNNLRPGKEPARLVVVSNT
jgi:hypothetical protein